MAERKALKKVRPGDPITAENWNALIEMVQRNDLRTTSGSGLSIVKTSMGTTLQVVSAGLGQGRIGKTSSTISARSSTAAGSGTVTPQSFDGTDLADDGDDVDVWNFSGTSIDTDKYCWFAEDESSGEYFIIAVEC